MKHKTIGLIWLAVATAACALPPDRGPHRLAANRADEPFAAEFSLPRAVAFMDAAAQAWQTRYGCVTCHTNGLYLAARAKTPMQGQAYSNTRAFARTYLERFVVKHESPKKQRGSIEGLVATSSFLAISDMATIGHLDAVTTRGLDHVLQAQDVGGGWGDWLKCKWPPYEIDDHFGVTLAALALGHAPVEYRRKDTTRTGIRKLREFLHTHPPSNPHQKGMLLWVAAHLDGVVDDVTRARWQDDLRELQRDDGGWRLVDIGKGRWKRTKDLVEELPSDAYATGFSVFVLREAGVPIDDPRLRRGLHWLREHQRQSGRWFVRSPRSDGKHFISHAATQFAVMAFLACDEGAMKD